MLKRKLKQWLAVNEPGALPVKTEPPGSPPTCVTPPLPRSPSTSDVNKYPSLKKKILGPKMVDADHPHAESPTTSSKENASTLGNKYSSNYASTSDLAAAAAFVHAAAGDRAAASGQRGLIATDLFGFLRPVLNPDERADG